MEVFMLLIKIIIIVYIVGWIVFLYFDLIGFIKSLDIIKLLYFFIIVWKYKII